MNAKQTLIFLAALTSSLAFAQNIVDASVDDKVYKAGDSVTLKIKLDENPRGCGMTVNFGDGSSEVKHRVKSGVVTSLAKTYSQDGEYLVSINGKAIFAGLKSVGACNGQQTVKVVVNSSYLEEQERKRNQLALEAAAASAAAEKAAAEREAQAKRIAELEAKLKAAEAQASKTPEQIAEEARIAAEAKAYAEAKVAAEMKAAAKERALAEARAAAEAKAAAKAKAEAEARAVAKAQAAAKARAAAQAARNRPLQESALQAGITYKYYSDGSCKPSAKAFCLTRGQYKQLCDWASGITVNVRKMAAVMASPWEFSRFLSEGGDITNIRYSWKDSLKTCSVSWTIQGIYKGTQRRINYSEYATNFIVTKNGKVLIHYTSHRL